MENEKPSARTIESNEVHYLCRRMQKELFRQSPDSNKLILFFNGWAMTREAVSHLAIPPEYDLLHVWDYRTDTLDFDWSSYREICLSAWSMGVWAAERLSREGRLPSVVSAVAICGTGYPMDDPMGIPLDIFRGTLDGLTEENRLRFNRRMCGGKSLKHLFEALAARETDEIKAELGRVYEEEEKRLKSDDPHPVAPLSWDKALIGAKDRIIPAKNQQAFWQMRGCRNIETVAEGDHYLFNRFTEWEQLWS
ncbi:hypothetical protein CLI74_04880 [Porphyromonas gingivalis]|uniref:DUF452 family protein n=1 Tax=Porphyromonas gingivalis TaxID=837 RepID=UPI000BE71603|nr:pimeloyl-ACP methyl esterase BioG family protein [Porphyromonas gingivalis]PDP56690.1 hypothetical protein CLI74_04880 [Porphyromonas gingivalis]